MGRKTTNRRSYTMTYTMEPAKFTSAGLAGFPSGYRAVTLAGAEANSSEICASMPYWGIWQVEGGKIDGNGYGCHVTSNSAGNVPDYTVGSNWLVTDSPYPGAGPEVMSSSYYYGY